MVALERENGHVKIIYFEGCVKRDKCSVFALTPLR